MSGYVKAYRRRFKHPLFKGEKFCRGYAWDWMVSMARYEATEYDVRGTTVAVDRGQFIASPDEMATAWNWSRSAVNRFLTRLKSEHMIEQSAGHKKTLITICNYEEYQSGETEPGHKSGQSTGHKPDTNRTVKKKGKKGKKEDTSVSSAQQRGTRLSKNWNLPKDWGDWALEEGWPESVIRIEADCFKDHWLGVSGQKGVKLDWQATWRNWMRRCRSPRVVQGGQPSAAELMKSIDLEGLQ